jgi:hypothetical protein
MAPRTGDGFHGGMGPADHNDTGGGYDNKNNVGGTGMTTTRHDWGVLGLLSSAHGAPKRHGAPKLRQLPWWHGTGRQ